MANDVRLGRMKILRVRDVLWCAAIKRLPLVRIRGSRNR